MAYRFRHRRPWVVAMVSCLFLTAANCQQQWVPETVRQHIPSQLPIGVNFYPMGGPTDSASVTWIGSARDDLYSASPHGLYRRDLKTNRWEKDGAGLPDDRARQVAATTGNLYALSY